MAVGGVRRAAGGDDVAAAGRGLAHPRVREPASRLRALLTSPAQPTSLRGSARHVLCVATNARVPPWFCEVLRRRTVAVRVTDKGKEFDPSRLRRGRLGAGC